MRHRLSSPCEGVREIFRSAMPRYQADGVRTFKELWMRDTHARRVGVPPAMSAGIEVGAEPSVKNADHHNGGGDHGLHQEPGHQENGHGRGFEDPVDAPPHEPLLLTRHGRLLSAKTGRPMKRPAGSTWPGIAGCASTNRRFCMSSRRADDLNRRDRGLVRGFKSTRPAQKSRERAVCEWALLSTFDRTRQPVP